jgi:hypothetical protein
MAGMSRSTKLGITSIGALGMSAMLEFRTASCTRWKQMVVGATYDDRWPSQPVCRQTDLELTHYRRVGVLEKALTRLRCYSGQHCCASR